MKAAELLREIDNLLHEAEHLEVSSEEEFQDAMRIINNVLVGWAAFDCVSSRYWKFYLRKTGTSKDGIPIFHVIVEPKFRLKIPLLNHPETEPDNPVEAEDGC